MGMPNQRDPGSLDTTGIIEVLGEEAFGRLCQTYGGTRLRVPKCPSESHDLSKAIGFKAAMALSQRAGGEALSVPRDAVRTREKRNHAIKQRFDAGDSAPALARAFELTERQIRRILTKIDHLPEPANDNAKGDLE